MLGSGTGAVQDFTAKLCAVQPRSGPVLDVLADHGLLVATCADDALPAAGLLCRIVERPRHPLFDARHVYWSALEQLVNPASVTQKIAIPFATGERVARTCVSAAVCVAMLRNDPAFYLYMIEGLTSPRISFEIVRRYPDPAAFRRRLAWLSEFTGDSVKVSQIAPDTLRMQIAPDETTAERAAAEHAHRRYSRYHFGDAKTKDTRKANDVLMQSAITNYVLQGNYVAVADVDRRTGSGGVPLPDNKKDTYSFNCMLQDLGRSTLIVPT